jgi:hypothetical protein
LRTQRSTDKFKKQSKETAAMAFPFSEVVFFVPFGVVVYFYWLSHQERITDRPTIHALAGKYGLRVVSVMRISRIPFRFSRDPFPLGWIDPLDAEASTQVGGFVRFYDVTVENVDGHRGSIYVAFDSSTSLWSEKLKLLDRQGLMLTPPERSA